MNGRSNDTERPVRKKKIPQQVAELQFFEYRPKATLAKKAGTALRRPITSPYLCTTKPPRRLGEQCFGLRLRLWRNW
jgi:hypothetical protein